MRFIRHGQSTFNVVLDQTGRDPQIPDPPLTPLGEKQVMAAALALVGQGIQTLISSPYTRALQTAALLAATLNLSIRVEPLVGERRLYSCDIGTPLAKLRQAWPAVDFSAMTETGPWWLPFHETVTDVHKRIRAFEAKQAARPDADQTLVVSHSLFINALTGAFLDNAEVIAWD